jgi:hypothetical protein
MKKTEQQTRGQKTRWLHDAYLTVSDDGHHGIRSGGRLATEQDSPKGYWCVQAVSCTAFVLQPLLLRGLVMGCCEAGVKLV